MLSILFRRLSRKDCSNLEGYYISANTIVAEAIVTIFMIVCLPIMDLLIRSMT